MFTTLIFWNLSTPKQTLQIIYEIKYELKVEIFHWKPSIKFKIFIKSHKLTEYQFGEWHVLPKIKKSMEIKYVRK